MLHRARNLVIAVGVLLLALGLTPAVAQASGDQVRCRDVTVPVALAAGGPTQYQIWGQYCAPVGRPVATVQVLLAGLNYGHVYWDFPFDADRYSYVRWANRAGFATFNLDRIGIGHSSHPASANVTLESNAYTIHQVVAALRDGAVRGPAARSVVLVGHSYGSEIAKLEASLYRDVDALVLTGNAHHISPSAEAFAAQLGQPVSEVPRLAAEVPPGDSGYVTVQDAQRPALMYNVADADARVVALDIATKETNTMGEIFTIGDAAAPSVTAELRIPVLIVDGSRDRLSCAPDATDCSSAATIEAAEQPFYPHTHVDAIVLARAGHAINLHRNADTAYRGILAWTKHHMAAK